LDADFKVSMSDMVIALSKAIDLVSPKLTGHHQRVAYIAGRISETMKLDIYKRTNIILAGYLHDVGAISLSDKNIILAFDNEDTTHAEVGYKLLNTLPELSLAANYIREHHTPYQKGQSFIEGSLLLGGQILYLADRVDILLDKSKEPLAQKDNIISWFKERTGNKFMPEVVEAFIELTHQESFWFDIVSSNLESQLKRLTGYIILELDLDGLTNVGRIFSQIIDFRSRFTATHSSGVASAAVFLADKVGFSRREKGLMRVAGYLHDLGKLAVPSEILEKKGQLSIAEVALVKTHTYHTYRILEKVSGLEKIPEWAALHHERLDGKGYPFHVNGNNLSLGSRIMAVADVFTALTENRPYRASMNKSQTTKILRLMAANKTLDPEITAIAIFCFDELNRLCRREQLLALDKYKKFWQLEKK